MSAFQQARYNRTFLPTRKIVHSPLVTSDAIDVSARQADFFRIIHIFIFVFILNAANSLEIKYHYSTPFQNDDKRREREREREGRPCERGMLVTLQAMRGHNLVSISIKPFAARTIHVTPELLS